MAGWLALGLLNGSQGGIGVGLGTAVAVGGMAVVSTAIGVGKTAVTVAWLAGMIWLQALKRREKRTAVPQPTTGTLEDKLDNPRKSEDCQS